MQSTAPLPKIHPHHTSDAPRAGSAPRRQRPDPIFNQEFYAPYVFAAQTALSALCRARRGLVLATGEDVRALTYRLKTASSIRGKLAARALPVSQEAAASSLHDIAGIRAVLSSVSQVYAFAALVERCPALQITCVRDYIAHPKDSGYRSLHIVADVLVGEDGEARPVPVEIQLRTASMDIWASIEHQMVYKPL